ncbi:protein NONRESPONDING TO OXYLIPINS 2, mitochondrial-like [Mangifera indica]|uniref:protein NONRESPONDING TO OXYLIPINS 2, mitochondrial-like n=1 Tax=Mangifera indica TaxID=29780 RepID=UPI001CFB6C68|nr:protein NONRESPONDING TO OXYLIPINS 2, mitochondrial-like [Mangifera indica]
MAGNGSRILSRLSSTRSPSFSVKPRTKNSVMPTISPLKSSSQPLVSSSVKRISRLPVELSCLMSMMPLHSAVASARLRSFLSIDSQSWGLVPQGISMPL